MYILIIFENESDTIVSGIDARESRKIPKYLPCKCGLQKRLPSIRHQLSLQLKTINKLNVLKYAKRQRRQIRLTKPEAGCHRHNL